KSEFMQFAASELMKELLNAVDSFDLALHNTAGDENTLRGFELIYKQLQDTLARFGLKPIEAKGKKFDPNFHQAVSTQPSKAFEEAAEAYSVLSDSQKRANYDRFGHAGVTGAAGAGGFDPSVFADFSDILGDIFGFGDIFGSGRRGGTRVQRGADLRYDLELT